MKWHLRRSQRKDDYTEQFVDTREPRKSILRSKSFVKENSGFENGECSRNMASVADIRSASASRQAAPHWATTRESPSGLRSVDNRRRNVLFLDEVERSRRPSNADYQFTRSQTSSPSSSSTSYASYPTSYQPSPLFSKKDYENNEIELISRAPLLPAETERTPEEHISPRLKRWLRMSSLNQRWKQKHLDSFQAEEQLNGYENSLPVATSIQRYPNKCPVGADAIQTNRWINDRDLSSANLQGRTNHNFPTSVGKTIEPNSPAVRRPVRPTVIELDPKATVYDGLKHIAMRPSTDSAGTVTPRGLDRMTDSVETLRPPTQRSQVNQSPSRTIRCFDGPTPKSVANNSSNPGQSYYSHAKQVPSTQKKVTPIWLDARKNNESEAATSTSIKRPQPTVRTTRIVYAPDACITNRTSNNTDWQKKENTEKTAQWRYIPISSNSAAFRTSNTVTPNVGYRSYH